MEKTYKKRDRSYNRVKPGFWKQGDGKLVLITAMQKDHLVNSLNVLLRRSRFNRSRLPHKFYELMKELERRGTRYVYSEFTCMSKF